MSEVAVEFMNDEVMAFGSEALVLATREAMKSGVDVHFLAVEAARPPISS